MAAEITGLVVVNAASRRSFYLVGRGLADPRLAIVILIISTALHRFRFEYFSTTWRLEHFAIVYLAAVHLPKLIRQNWRLLLAWNDVPLVLYFALALVASLLNAPVTIESLKFFGLMLACFAIYWLVRNIVVDAKLLRTALITFGIVGSLQAIIGIVTWLLYLTGTNLGIVLYPLASGNRVRLCSFSPSGTLVEPNIFGAYVMGTCVLVMSIFASNVSNRFRAFIVGGITLMLIAVALSLTRSAWMALAIGVILVTFLARDKFRLKAYILPGLIVAALAGYIVSNVRIPCAFTFLIDGTVAAVPVPAPASPGGSYYLSPKPKLKPLAGDRIFAGHTVSTRLNTYRSVIKDWLKNRWIGNGVNTFGQRHRTTSFTPAWISNVELMALHDTGVLGLLTLTFWGGWVLRDLLRVLRRSAFTFTRAGLMALGVAFTALLVAYQLTTAFWLGFTWVYLGLIRAGISILQKE